MAHKRKAKRITTKAVQETEDKPYAPRVSQPVQRPEPDEEPWGNDGLTVRHRLFVAALVGPAGGNATKAAQMAGYRDDNNASLRATASELLTKPNIADAIAQALAKLKLSPEWSRNALQEIASVSMANFLTRDAHGHFHVDLDKAAQAGALGQIKELTEEVISADGDTKVIRRKIKLHDRAAALALLLKLQGLVKDTPTEAPAVTIVLQQAEKPSA